MVLTIRFGGSSLFGRPIRIALQCHRHHHCRVVTAQRLDVDPYSSASLTAQARAVCNNTIPLLAKDTQALIWRKMDDPTAQLAKLAGSSAVQSILPGRNAQDAAAWLCQKRTPGYLYALQQPKHNILKLGYSNNPDRRESELRCATNTRVTIVWPHIVAKALLARCPAGSEVSSPQHDAG